MNKTDISFKVGVIKEVINCLTEKGRCEKLIKKLESIEDVNKAYIVANRYARNCIHYCNKSKKAKFINEAKRLAEIWVKNGNKWIVEESIGNNNDTEKVNSEIEKAKIINETDDEFINKINDSDKSIKMKSNVSSILNKSEVLFKLLFENISIKVKKEFIDKLNIDIVLVGYKDGVEVYYSESVDKYFEMI